MKSYIPLIKRDWRLLLFGFVMTFFSGPGQTYFIALFGGEIRHDLSINHGEFGAIYSAATLVSALILLWSGTLLDRVALPKFSLGIIVALALACVMMSASQNIFMLFLAILALRHFGQGLMSMSSASTMMRYVTANKSKATSLASMGYASAEALFPSLIILLLLNFSWRQSWLIIGLVLLLCVPLLISFTLREHPIKHKQYLANLSQNQSSDTRNTISSKRLFSKKQWTRSEVIRDPLFYLFMPSLIAQSMLYTGFMFHQIHLIETKEWSLTLWASIFIVFALVSIISSLMLGALSDKVGAIKLAPFTALGSAIGLMILSSSNSHWVAFVFMICMAFSTAAMITLTTPFLAERYGNEHFGSIKSLSTFAMVLSSAISPVLIGWFIDKGVSIDILARGFSVYAFATVGLSYLAYHLSSKESASQ